MGKKPLDKLQISPEDIRGNNLNRFACRSIEHRRNIVIAIRIELKI